MKKLLLFALAGLSVSGARAGISDLIKQAADAKTLEQATDVGVKAIGMVGKTKTYPTDTKISFEIKNKSGKDLSFNVTSDDVSINVDGTTMAANEWLKVGADKTVQIPLDVKKTTFIFVWNPFAGDEGAPELYTVRSGKTAYLTWDGVTKRGKELPLRSQTGPALGFAGRTDTGLSLKNNVKDNEVSSLTTQAEVVAQAEGAQAEGTAVDDLMKEADKIRAALGQAASPNLATAAA